MSTRKVSSFLAAGTLALLSACGGSGDDNNSTASVSSTPVAITTANQTAVSRATVAGGLSIAQAQVANASGRASVLSVAPGATTLGVSTIDLAARRALTSYLARHPGGAAATTAHAEAIQSQTVNCDVSGSETDSFNDRDNDNTTSVGDSATLTFAQCRDSTGYAINGSVTLTISAINGSLVTASTVFQNVTVTAGAISYSLNGSVTLAESDVNAVTDDSLTIGSRGLTVGVASSAYNDAITYSSGMTIDIQEPDSASQTQLTLNGSFFATSIGGLVTISTPTPIVQLSTDEYPSSGVVRIVGANGSTLVLTVENNTTVQLQLDLQGDTVIDSTTTKTWNELLPQLQA
jgi:hypothetical protein